MCYSVTGASQAAEEFKTPWAHFDGLGYNESTPSYLRFHGKIQNLFISKRDIVKIIQELWQARHAFEKMVLKIDEGDHFSQIDTNQIETSNLIPASLLEVLPNNPTMAQFVEHYLNVSCNTLYNR